jgi:DNA-binding response OmpR family regulator
MSGIVIYEENDLMRALLAEWLSEDGYRVRSATPREMHPGDAELVIASVYMPKQAGALLREIKAANPGAPLIALSGQFRAGLSARGEAARALGVQQVLAKPLHRDELLNAVRAMIGAPH